MARHINDKRRNLFFHRDLGNMLKVHPKLKTSLLYYYIKNSLSQGTIKKWAEELLNSEDAKHVIPNYYWTNQRKIGSLSDGLQAWECIS